MRKIRANDIYWLLISRWKPFTLHFITVKLIVVFISIVFVLFSGECKRSHRTMSVFNLNELIQLEFHIIDWNTGNNLQQFQLLLSSYPHNLMMVTDVCNHLWKLQETKNETEDIGMKSIFFSCFSHPFILRKDNKKNLFYC